MKFKHILIVSLLLAIFAIGAVSASEDVSDDNLTVIDEVDDSIAEIDDSSLEEADDSLGESNDEIVGVDYDKDKIDCEIYTDLHLDDEDGVIEFTSSDPKATGDLIIYIENVKRLTKTITYSDYDSNGVCKINIRPYELNIDSNGLFDNWRVTFNGDVLVEADRVRILPYTFYFEDEWGNDLDDGYYGYGEKMNLYVYIPKDATARLTVEINGKTYNVAYKNGEGKITIDTTGWKLGEYKVIGKYYGDNRYLQRVVEDSLVIKPNVECPEIMALGENEQIKISASPGLSGQANITVFQWDTLNNIYKQIEVTTLNVRNGLATYSLANYKEGEYRFYVDYKISTYEITRQLDLEVKKNSPGFSSSITPTTITQGQYVTVKLTGPVLTGAQASIYIDDEFFKTALFTNGQLNEVLTDLTPGSHKVNVFLYHDEANQEYFYSNTKYVTVNSKSTPTPQPAKPTPTPTPQPAKDTLTLSTVKVKRSASKLVLTATVKTNGAAKSGVKVTFKFNGKTYSAKTNAKGIAKATIKKSVLKKLKVGKKVKYQASYGKLTVSKTAKVKK